ncbi:MAG: monovalent cation/H(+) antiporter subunit G [Lachnospiraceae bacterium]|nr:monovalent cation/H(+) antiporter subunit G [Lachnospiraceae bacterium]
MTVTDIIGLVLICLGALCEIPAIIGVFRYKHALMRMHPAAIGDTLGLLLVALGAAFLTGWSFTVFKFFLIVAFMWLTGPVSTHMLSLMTYRTDKKDIADSFETININHSEGEDDEDEDSED